MKLTTGLVTISGVRHNPQLYDEFLDDMAYNEVDRFMETVRG